MLLNVQWREYQLWRNSAWLFLLCTVRRVAMVLPIGTVALLASQRGVWWGAWRAAPRIHFTVTHILRALLSYISVCVHTPTYMHTHDQTFNSASRGLEPSLENRCYQYKFEASQGGKHSFSMTFSWIYLLVHEYKITVSHNLLFNKFSTSASLFSPWCLFHWGSGSSRKAIQVMWLMAYTCEAGCLILQLTPFVKVLVV